MCKFSNVKLLLKFTVSTVVSVASKPLYAIAAPPTVVGGGLWQQKVSLKYQHLQTLRCDIYINIILWNLGRMLPCNCYLNEKLY